MENQYRGLAYVVGVNEYLQANKLSNAVYDAKAIAAELKTVGFYVKESYDIDLKQFVNEFDNFKKELSKFNVGLFYFAGHGVEFEGKNYLLLTDSIADNETSIKHTTFDLQSIVNDMHKTGCKMNIQIIDACRNNPYSTGNQGIIIECKNRQMSSITQATIEEWVKELINNIECAQSAPELADVDLANTTLNTGLLLIHANDTFNSQKFYNYLSKISFPNRRNPINIFIAANDRISQWMSLFAKIKTSYHTGFTFIYPSINESNKTSQVSLTINGMYSKYLLGKSTYFVTKSIGENTYSEPRTQNMLFFFDESTVDNFRYAWSLFKYYQLQGSDKYVFLFYPRKNGDVDFIKENFITALKSGETPIDDFEAAKIAIDFIDNRYLSPIETGGIL